MKAFFRMLALLLAVSGCQSPEQKLVGVWKTDSIFNYVNGFTETLNVPDEHWPLFEYSEDGVLTEHKFGQQRALKYQLVSADSLVYTDSAGTVLSGFSVLKLDREKLVLKKTHKPFLSGKNQQLYEIRFFTKVSSDSLPDAHQH
ncbi:hypothetical protein ACFQ4C_18555 [Larkinella insperata]|uniref:Lipocalin-like domain-containing protein n=1 Tax=Larkinella insperata TaxID=332158 RepID=A0ABW3QND6_9BACT|nr:hypothetical protein [Larkinella insperata]